MNHKIKTIILGFALMFLCGILTLLSAITQHDLPGFLVLLSYGLFIGFILILVGLYSSHDEKK